MKYSINQKNSLLRRRGFTEEEIANNLSDYLAGDSWKIRSISVEEVRESFDSDVLNKLFDKDSIPDYSFANPFTVHGFKFFANNPIQFNVPTAELDPYIAAFVRAVNLCGAFTGMSCDGWHKDQDKSYYREMKLWFPDRYSVLWLSIIIEYVFGESWKGKPKYDDTSLWYDQWEPVQKDKESFKAERLGLYQSKSMMIYRITKGREKEAYSKVYKYAEFLMEHKEELLSIRSNVIEVIRDIEYIDSVGFLELRRRMLSICKNELILLSQNENI